MQFTRLSVGNQNLVYVILLGKTIKYRFGRRSHIAYIGTTSRGVDRIAASAAAVAPRVLSLHGVKEFSVRLVTCTPRRRVRTWRKLERAMLLAFRERYGDIPRLNTQGRNIRETDEFKIFHK